MKLLIVDDEQTARYGMRRAVDFKGRIYEAANLAAATKIWQEEQPELILLDLNLAGESGFDLLQTVQDAGAPTKVVIITAHGNEKIAVEAMRRGAFDYLSKPFDIDDLRLTVRNALDQIQLQEENQALKQEIAALSGIGEIIGTSEPMRGVYGVLEKVAEIDVTVLLLGESGSGKELIARELHRKSPRSELPFVTVNCAAIPENLVESELFGHEKGSFTGAVNRRIGKFEQAHKGTLFMDEIGDMNLDTQAKVLRAVEDRRIERVGGSQSIDVDVRLISATHRDLRQMVKEGKFREDLYYRLEVVKIEVPPLRERREDIPLLERHFRVMFANRYKRDVPEIAPAALARLVEFPYPGNVRQLRNLVERLVVLNSTGAIEERDLPEDVRFYRPSDEVDPAEPRLDPFYRMDYRTAREAFEIRYLVRKLKEHDNNISRTAQAIGIHRQSLQQKIRELNLRPIVGMPEGPESEVDETAP